MEARFGAQVPILHWAPLRCGAGWAPLKRNPIPGPPKGAMLFGWFYVTKNQPKSMAPLVVLDIGCLICLICLLIA